MIEAVIPIVDDVLRRHDHGRLARRDAREIVRLQLVVDAAVGRDEHFDARRVENVELIDDAALVVVLQDVDVAGQ